VTAPLTQAALKEAGRHLHVKQTMKRRV
jgi:hypothetical protein